VGLKEYSRKRRFDVTPEPSPRPRSARPAKATALRFVVQKHRASSLHYDFRLEWDGVLLSWAVPKGPSTDPRVRRLAVAVEDHPLAYSRFEGVISPGEYGGGTVMIWDEGTYVPEQPDVGASLASGEIKFALAGRKLKGNWVLVHTGDEESRQWLLIKRRGDESAKTDPLIQEPRSVVSQRTMAEIALEEGGDVDRAASADPRGALPKRPRSRKRQARVHSA